MPTDIEKALEKLLTELEKEKDKPSKKIKDDIALFLDDCNALSTKEWKTKTMVKSKEMIVDNLEEVKAIEEEAELPNNLGLHMRWVVPIPPDPEVVAYVIARDLAQEAREKNGD